MDVCVEISPPPNSNPNTIPNPESNPNLNRDAWVDGAVDPNLMINRDAWVDGAVDPSSGSSTMLEDIVRVQEPSRISARQKVRVRAQASNPKSERCSEHNLIRHRAQSTDQS